MEGPWTPAGGILGEGVAQGATKFNKLARTMDDNYHDFKTRIFQQVNEASIIHRACKLVSPRTSRLVSVVSTDTFGRGIDVECINVAINYDMFDSLVVVLMRGVSTSPSTTKCPTSLVVELMMSASTSPSATTRSTSLVVVSMSSVSTSPSTTTSDNFGRGIDAERTNVAIN